MLKLDYKNITVDLSMLDYVKNSLRKFQHPPPETPQDVLHQWNKPNYGNKIQYTEAFDGHPALNHEQTKIV